MANDEEEPKVKLSTLTKHISCFICKNYFNEATTIIECLHTFCKACITKHLNAVNTCPKCKQVVHPSHPLNYISFDRTMQDIVYKLVPGLQSTNEQQPIINQSCKENNSKLKQIDTNWQVSDYHRNDEQINLRLIPSQTNDLKPLKRSYIRVSCLATVTHLKKFLASKLFDDIDRYKEFDLLCNDNLLGNDYNFKFISVTEWRSRVQPINITYRCSK